MNQEELKQRLIELLDIVPCEGGCCSASQDGRCIDLDHLDRCQIEAIVNNLIANGVTIRERGKWKDNIFCSQCGYAAEDDEGYILMSFDDFCPHCGADMRGDVE